MCRRTGSATASSAARSGTSSGWTWREARATGPAAAPAPGRWAGAAAVDMFDRHLTMAAMFDGGLTNAQDALRAALTPYGLWLSGPKLPSAAAELADLAAELDGSPYGTVWLGGSPGADLPPVRELL